MDRRNKIDHGKIATPEELRAEVQQALDATMQMVPYAEVAALSAKLAAAEERAKKAERALRHLEMTNVVPMQNAISDAVRAQQAAEAKLAEAQRDGYFGRLAAETANERDAAIARAEAAEAERDALRAKLAEYDGIQQEEQERPEPAEFVKCGTFVNTPEGGTDEAIRVGKTYFRELRADRDALRARLDDHTDMAQYRWKLAKGDAAFPGGGLAAYDTLLCEANAERDALAKQNASLRAALEEAQRRLKLHGFTPCQQITDALALTPPAALDELRRRERSIGAEEELRRIADLIETEVLDERIAALFCADLRDRADAIAAERHSADAGKKVEGEEK